MFYLLYKQIYNFKINLTPAGTVDFRLAANNNKVGARFFAYSLNGFRFRTNKATVINSKLLC